MNHSIRKAVSLAIAGTTLSLCAIPAHAATTYYNTWNAGNSAVGSATDGWTHTNGTGNSGALQPWYGPALAPGVTDPRPFGYKGIAALSWAINLTSAGDAGIISGDDATARYGSTPGYLPPDIDTAKGAWLDAEATPQGWRHQLDFGLIKSDVTTTIRLTPSVVGNAFADNFGISLYKGMNNQLSGSWSHHGSWHSGYIKGDTSAANLAKINGNNPLDITGLQFVTFIDSSGLGPYGGDYLEFTAQAGQVYTVILGGSDGGTSWGSPLSGYALEVSSVSAVPIPAAVWLFGSAIAGMGIFGRRKVGISA